VAELAWAPGTPLPMLLLLMLLLDAGAGPCIVLPVASENAAAGRGGRDVEWLNAGGRGRATVLGAPDSLNWPGVCGTEKAFVGLVLLKIRESMDIEAARAGDVCGPRGPDPKKALPNARESIEPEVAKSGGDTNGTDGPDGRPPVV
jgi:hypothetical protein